MSEETGDTIDGVWTEAPDPEAAAAARGGARLAEVIAARRRGDDPLAEAASRREARRRREAAEARRRARWRLHLLVAAFVMAYGAVAGRMAVIAASEPEEPTSFASSEPLGAVRAEITDRRGALLATNLPVWSLYARPDAMVDPARAARELSRLFPDEMNEADLVRRFTDGRRFLWLKRTMTPAERVAVHDIGEPGLEFGPREMRVYPAGAEAAHVLGGAKFGREGVRAAEIEGRAGIELALEERLRDPARAGEPVRLALDLRVQRAFADVLREAVARFDAQGAAGVLMEARTGEVRALVSLPDFDPNDRPIPTSGYPGDHPTFNRAAQGVYELGSVFKTFTVAMMLEAGLASPDTLVDTTGPLFWGRHRIRDAHRMPARMTVTDMLAKSSNTGTARLAMQAGAKRQKAFLGALGLLEPTEIELVEAATGRPMAPERWSEISVMTISFGHGLSVTPLHLAAGYATLVNGGLRVRPTLLAGAGAPRERVVSEETSRAMREMLRRTVTHGTGRRAEVPGYFVGGKTGTAEKILPTGGYAKDKTIAVFAGAFPMHDPRYVIVVAIDEGEDRTGPKAVRSAGFLAAPTTRAAIERIVPILGMRPEAPEAVAAAGAGAGAAERAAGTMLAAGGARP